MDEILTWIPTEEQTPSEEGWYLAYLVWPGDNPASGNVHMMKWMNNAGRWGWYAPMHSSPHSGITHWAHRPTGPQG